MSFYLLLATLVTKVHVHQLVERLGSERIEERDAAAARLKKTARFGDPELRKAARSLDREVALRAREILRHVRLRRESMQAIGETLQHAWTAFEEGDFDRSIKLADLLLGVDASFPAAQDLRQKALDAGGKEADLGSAAQTAQRWREEEELLLCDVRLPARIERNGIPADLVWIFWKERHPRDCGCGIFRKLGSMKIDLAFEDTSLEDILAFIRDFSGLNLVLDAKLSGPLEREEKITFKVKSLALGDVLRLLLCPRKMSYVVTEEDVVLITERGGR